MRQVRADVLLLESFGGRKTPIHADVRSTPGILHFAVENRLARRHVRHPRADLLPPPASLRLVVIPDCPVVKVRGPGGSAPPPSSELSPLQ